MRIRAEADPGAGAGGQKVRLLDERGRLVGHVEMTALCGELADPGVRGHVCRVIAEAINASALARTDVTRPGNVIL